MLVSNINYNIASVTLIQSVNLETHVSVSYQLIAECEHHERNIENFFFQYSVEGP